MSRKVLRRVVAIPVVVLLVMTMAVSSSVDAIQVPEEWKTDETAVTYISQYTDMDASHLVVAAGGGSLSLVDSSDLVLNSILKNIVYELTPDMKLYATEYTDTIENRVTTTYSYRPVEIGTQGYADDTVNWVSTGESVLYEDGRYELSEEGEANADLWVPITTQMPPVYIRKVAGIASGELTLQALGWSCGATGGQLMYDDMYLLQSFYIEVANFDSETGTFTRMTQVPISDENGVFTVNFDSYDYLVIYGAGRMNAYSSGPESYSATYTPTQTLTRDVPIANGGNITAYLPPIDIVPEDATIVVNSVTEGEWYTDASREIHKVSRGVKDYRVMTMDLISSGGEQIHALSDYVIVSIDIPSDLPLVEGYHYQMYRWEDSGAMTALPTDVMENRIRFATNHFSIYVLTLEPDSTTVTSPNTGEY